jgi:drug/metabolite transporter (DMT)-like permease
LSVRPSGGVRAALSSIVLLVVSLPHVIEDFSVAEPARAGVPAFAALTVLLAAYVAQLFGASLAVRGIAWGGRIIAVVGAIWVVGAVLIHGPEIRVDGLHWRSGALSIAGVVLVIAAGVLATWYGVLASQSSSRSA